jgi:hypothetical protein
MGVEHQFLGLSMVAAHERHPAVRQLHMRRLDHQRQPLARDRLVAPIEVISLAGGEAHRHERLGRNPRPFFAPRLGEPMHAVMRGLGYDGQSRHAVYRL